MRSFPHGYRCRVPPFLLERGLRREGCAEQVNGLPALILSRRALVVNGCVCVCVCDMHLASPIALLTSVLTIKVVKQFALQDGVKQQGVGEEMFV